MARTKVGARNTPPPTPPPGRIRQTRGRVRRLLAQLRHEYKQTSERVDEGASERAKRRGRTRHRTRSPARKIPAPVKSACTRRRFPVHPGTCVELLAATLARRTSGECACVRRPGRERGGVDEEERRGEGLGREEAGPRLRDSGTDAR
jgi:hypothetical protein